MFQNKTELLQLKKLLSHFKKLQSDEIEADTEMDLAALISSLDGAIHFYNSHDIFFAKDSDKKAMQNNLSFISSKIDKLIKKMDTELKLNISVVETEMHGIQIYSGYTRKKIKNCESLENLKAILLKIKNIISQPESSTVET